MIEGEAEHVDICIENSVEEPDRTRHSVTETEYSDRSKGNNII